jgi:hypothetical protein
VDATFIYNLSAEFSADAYRRRIAAQPIHGRSAYAHTAFDSVEQKRLARCFAG